MKLLSNCLAFCPPKCGDDEMYCPGPKDDYTHQQISPDYCMPKGKNCRVPKIDPTGCLDWKLSKVNGCRSETGHIWPYVGKAKMLLRCCSLFEKIVNKQLKIVNKIYKSEK